MGHRIHYRRIMISVVHPNVCLISNDRFTFILSFNGFVSGLWNLDNIGTPTRTVTAVEN